MSTEARYELSDSEIIITISFFSNHNIFDWL